jgi:8-oxo-dGTP diphosphatase
MLAIFSSVGTNGSESFTVPTSCDPEGAPVSAEPEEAGATTIACALALGCAETPGGAVAEHAAQPKAHASTAPIVFPRIRDLFFQGSLESSQVSALSFSLGFLGFSLRMRRTGDTIRIDVDGARAKGQCSGAMRIPAAAFRLAREAARHILRRPVVGIAAAARTGDGRWLLIRRGDTGDWALPGGTLEWGETLREGIEREILEEAGARVESLGAVSGVYSRPERDVRFHAVTIVVRARVSEPTRPPVNSLEILDVKLFDDADLPEQIGMGMGDMIRHARGDGVFWE